jgi:hypothetical protein
MGMFDTVRSEHPEVPAGHEYQTKSLGKALENYDLTAEGRLIRHHVEYELTPKDELPFPDKPYIGCMRPVFETLEDANLSRTINIYSWREGVMHTYYLTFVSGQLTKVVYEKT